MNAAESISPLSLYSGLTGTGALPGAAQSVLKKTASRWLDISPLSVVHKRHPAPSGNPHDYVSVAPYWWPDPNSQDGLPYVQRDGEVNPEFLEYDNVSLEHLATAASQLTLCYLFTDSTSGLGREMFAI